MALLGRGDAIARMEQATGEEGIGVEDFVTARAATFVDIVCLQQDAFDEVDAAVPMDRQRALFDRVHRLATRDDAFADKEAVRQHSTRITGLFKTCNLAKPGSQAAECLLAEIDAADCAAPMTRPEAAG